MSALERFALLDLGPGVGVELHEDVESPLSGWLVLRDGDPWPTVVGWLACVSPDVAHALAYAVDRERFAAYAQESAENLPKLHEELVGVRSRTVEGMAVWWEWVAQRSEPLDVWLSLRATQAAADWVCDVSRRCRVRVHASTSALWDWSRAPLSLQSPGQVSVTPNAAPTDLLDLAEFLRASRDRGVTQTSTLDCLAAEWCSRLAALDTHDRQHAAELVCSFLRSPLVVARRDEIVQRFAGATA